LGGPAFFGFVEIVVTPKFEHHFRSVDFEFIREHLGESSQGETPLVFTSTESDITFLG
jgi:hypothetical protein